LSSQNEQTVVVPVCPAVACVTTVSVQRPGNQGDAKAGEGKIAMCIGCHGIKATKPASPRFYKVPMISGQGAKYIVSP
jgi:cytochrome c553